METLLAFPLNNAQIELLKVFDKKLDDVEMQELKEYLLDLKFRKFQKLVDKSVEERKYSAIDLKKINDEHLRTAYKSNKK